MLVQELYFLSAALYIAWYVAPENLLTQMKRRSQSRSPFSLTTDLCTDFFEEACSSGAFVHRHRQ
ncbi:hypothetical protein H6G94_29515 [Nostoc punctiforme FACHB-252]|uniref:Transposase n=1 Tax=Nostoc punctiforme FACHB-252 TaxID=1357509 RepID=A0ABR8HJR5_NOSPU|nr:hypothetical protein [Nostoc punctiforme]MBD2615343.1 hypothetical protein [Nostoc punctiforme FACHB-252]